MLSLQGSALALQASEVERSSVRDDRVPAKKRRALQGSAQDSVKVRTLIRNVRLSALHAPSSQYSLPGQDVSALWYECEYPAYCELEALYR